ncbi:MAG: NAD(P)H-hydrate dehydratase [Chloroflexi bacterium]|nr:NAD(P)H-hydrate dehydratase [Chloroflexota bacterium]
MQVVSTSEMRRIEAAADAAGHHYADMMELAGRAVAEAIRARRTDPAQILFLIGPGNNGGDGLVAARYLQEWGHECTLYIWQRSETADPLLVRAQSVGIVTVWAAEDKDQQRLAILARECEVLVDALLGTGAKGPLRGTLPDLLAAVGEGLRERGAPAPERFTRIGGLPPEHGPAGRPLVVALDGPSGLDFDSGEIDDLALWADLTVTFAYPKPGQFAYPGAARIGELLVADIGLDPALGADTPLQVATHQMVRDLLPERAPDAHKGSFGKALVVGGSPNYIGAPCLAAEGAYRVGAGLVTLGVAERIQPTVAGHVTEATYLLLPHDLGALTEAALRVLAEEIGGYDALLVGPGMGREEHTGEFLRGLLQGGRPSSRRAVGFAAREEAHPPHKIDLPPTVLDADALNLLAEQGSWWEGAPRETVVTPHPGEMARLTGKTIAEVQGDRVGIARAQAAQWGVTVLLKGAHSIVAAPDGRATIIPYANALMASAGTGDVLAGAVVGLMAQGLSAYHAAICGAYLHSLAGEYRRRDIGAAGLLAGDLLPLLPRALRALRGA